MVNWIDEIAAEKSRKDEQANADVQEAIAASLLISQESPEFLRQLKVELGAMIADLPKIGVEGSLTDASQPEFETRYYIHLRKVSLHPRLTEVNLFHRTGSYVIRCHPMNRKAFELHFAVHPKGGSIAVYADNAITYMNPHQTAQFLLRSEVDAIRPR